MRGKVLPLILGVILVFFVIAGTGKIGGTSELENISPTLEPTPVATSTPVPTPSPTVSPTEEPDQSNVIYVWISYTGSKYHSYAGCSGMKGPSRVPLDTAIAMGKEPCNRCY